MEYHLHPPFFRSDPYPSFAHAWEVFCCRLLNLEYGTTAIRRRKPPEQGIDLIWHTEGLAYQCKSVEHEVGKFQLNKAKESLKTALTYQPQIGWKKYVICTNVEITGSQELALRKISSDIDFYEKDRWQDLCRRFHEDIAEYFHIIMPVAPAYMPNEIKKIYQRFAKDFSPRFSSQENLLHVFVAVHKYNTVFNLQVPATLTGYEFLLLLKELLHIPEPDAIPDEGTFISYYLCVSEKEVALNQKLGELQLEDRPVFMILRYDIQPSLSGKVSFGTYEGAVRNTVTKSKVRLSALDKLVLEQFRRKIEVALDEAVNHLKQD